VITARRPEGFRLTRRDKIRPADRFGRHHRLEETVVVDGIG
jgi:hypothetical protein